MSRLRRERPCKSITIRLDQPLLLVLNSINTFSFLGLSPPFPPPMTVGHKLARHIKLRFATVNERRRKNESDPRYCFEIPEAGVSVAIPLAIVPGLNLISRRTLGWFFG